MFALVDVNSMYVSCERSFNPRLKGVPVVALGNNDHCVIARSDEAKKLGIKMGAARFQIQDLIDQHNVQLCSSNFALYGDMSARFQSLMYNFVEDVEPYSIDEVFLKVDGSYDTLYPSYQGLGESIRNTVMQWLRLPVCIGFAPTKTLAKVANRIAKKNPELEGICVLTNQAEVDTALEQFEIEDLWGVGYRYAKWLKNNGITNARQLRNAEIEWIRKKMTVQGVRLVYELRGYPARLLEDNPLPKRTISVAPSFGKLIPDLTNITDALTTHLARCCEKLRKQNSIARHLTIYLHTNRNRKTPGRPDLASKQYSASRTVKLPFHSNNLIDFLPYGISALQSIYQFGYPYQKVGIILNDIVPEDNRQAGVFADAPTPEQLELGHVIDGLNRRFGRDAVYVASQRKDREWEMVQGHLSQRYTTNWNELLVAY
ncbi:Y-family DNA polymerase [Spirosoma aureum]|uniref:Y-family DNA polymerase n=1 Tax=Spirosoma aureum TaxID=2692134 RepID=A0A6G9ATA3_9BACT|nr:Y-family DNA polymerase [Spirosoma aureum]QIP15717.1 Y-family DNA polymerase [Spirosoma aureum]